MGRDYIGAIDQGTTSSRFVVFDRNCKVVASAQKEHKQIFPNPGWVEHDPEEIIENTGQVIRDALAVAGINGGDLAAIGVTNQRETTVAWDPRTGKPYYNAIVWQDTRTAAISDALKERHGDELFWRKCGLPVSTYFSGTKMKWMLDNVPEIQKAATDGRLMFGTIDTWLIWRLSGGAKKGTHVTDTTNASRTLLMDIATTAWDPGMLEVFGIDAAWLPDIRSSSEEYCRCDPQGLIGADTPISGILGDQQAALCGQCCFEPGQAKNTYGTGCFLLMNTGNDLVHSKHGMLTTVAYSDPVHGTHYALEGSIAVAGSLIQWLRDNLMFFNNAPEVEELARKVNDNGGVYFVPAFSGLFAPHWDNTARGLMIGLTHYVNRGHIARAALEAVAFQTWEVMQAMAEDAGKPLAELKVDGGMVENDLLMQFQSDLLGLPVSKPQNKETTVLGAAFAAGLAVGFWSDKDTVCDLVSMEKTWTPNMTEQTRNQAVNGWLRAVEKSRGWIR